MSWDLGVKKLRKAGAGWNTHSNGKKVNERKDAKLTYRIKFKGPVRNVVGN